MLETSKAMMRRIYDKRFTTRWLVGTGIDIGSGNDSLHKLRPILPMMGDVRPWDMPDGDAMLMQGVPDDCYDFVHSSHCLEHLVDPEISLRNWIRICKPGGYIIFMVPEEDLYEQGVFPSTYNTDHKWTFTVGKAQSWSPKSVNLMALLMHLAGLVEILKIEVLDACYVFDLPRIDQTASMFGESAIEVVLRKRTQRELQRKGRLPKEG